jgi:hypothetical protein
VTPPSARFSETHRRIIGSRLKGIEAQLDRLGELGVDLEDAAILRAVVREVKDDVDVLLPPAPRHELRAILVDILTVTYELRPTALRAYGSLSDQNADYLEKQATRLIELTETLLDRVEQENRDGGGA